MSRGSNSFNTYKLDVSMYPIQKPTAIQYKNDNEEITLITNNNKAIPYILDYTDNPFVKNSNKTKVNY